MEHGAGCPNKGGEGSVQQWHMPWKSQPLKFTGWSEVADGETMGITDKRRVLMAMRDLTLQMFMSYCCARRLRG